MRASSSTFGHCCSIETRASNSVFPYWYDVGHVSRALRLRCGLQTLRLGIEVVLSCRLSAQRLGIGVMLRRELWALCRGIGVMMGRMLRALRLGIAWIVLISLTSEVWTLLSDDLSLEIFRQSTIGILKNHSSTLFLKFIFDAYCLYAREVNLTSPLYINSWRVYCIKKSLTSLFYIIHVLGGP